MALEEQEILRIIGNLDPRTGYTARVRAFNRFGTPSDWSEAISFNTGDINVPGAIATVYLAAGARMILAQWSAITDTAFDHYEIYVNTTANFTPDTNHLVASPEAGTIYQITKYWNGSALVDLLVGKTYYVKIYWVDGSNNKTLMGTEVSATTGVSVNEDGIQSSTIVADRIATGTLLASYTLSGTIKTGDTGARVELDSDGFRGYAADGIAKTIEYKTSDGSLTVVGNISGGTIDIGGADSTSFHVDVSGNMWLGAATFAGSPPFKVTSTGALTATNGTFTGTLTGTINNSSGTISGGTITGALIQTGAAGTRPRIAIRNTTDTYNFASIYQVELYPNHNLNTAPAKIYADYGTIISSWEYLHLESPSMSGGVTSYLDIETGGTIVSSSTIHFNNASGTSDITGVNLVDANLLTVTGTSTLAALTATTGTFSSTLNGQSNIQQNGSTVINTSRQFVGIGGVNTSGAISTSSTLTVSSTATFNGLADCNNGLSVTGTSFLSATAVTGTLAVSSSTTTATLFITAIPTLSAFTIGMNGSQVAIVSSSATVKRQIDDLTPEYDTTKIYELRPRSFKWRAEDNIRPTEDQKYVGFIAEEVEAVDPTLVLHDVENGRMDVEWRGLTTYMLAEIQKLRKELDDVKESK